MIILIMIITMIILMIIMYIRVYDSLERLNELVDSYPYIPIPKVLFLIPIPVPLDLLIYER